MPAPNSPAVVSGPGALSRRTDSQPIMDMPDPAYGEQSEFRAMQAGAPMMQEPSMPRPEHGMFDPSARPDEPVTSGIGSGPGAGPEQAAYSKSDLFAADARELTPFMPDLMQIMNRGDAPQGYVQWLRHVRNLQAG